MSTPIEHTVIDEDIPFEAGAGLEADRALDSEGRGVDEGGHSLCEGIHLIHKLVVLVVQLH